MRRSTVNTGDPWSADAVIDLVREVIKLAIILVYAVFAITTLVTTQDPLVFAPILPWALWSGWRTSNASLTPTRRPTEDRFEGNGRRSDYT